MPKPSAAAAARRPYIATKAGKRLPTQVTSGYTLENLREWVKRSRDYLEVDILDLVQLHCPPTDLYYQPSVFDALDRLQDEKLIRNYGVSVEKIEEAIKAIEYPNVVSVQIIFNILRQRPIDLFFELAKKKNVAILARVPLASGLLSGKFTRASTFDKADHRNFNRNGEFFDVGETFSGMPYEKGLEVVEKIRPLVTNGDMAQFALRWILMFDAVSVVIPGRPNRGAVKSQRWRVRSAASFARDDGEASRDLRDRRQTLRSSALVRPCGETSEAAKAAARSQFSVRSFRRARGRLTS